MRARLNVDAGKMTDYRLTTLRHDFPDIIDARVAAGILNQVNDGPEDHVTFELVTPGEGEFALFEAVSKRDTALALAAIDAGAEVNAYNPHIAVTSLFMACQNNDPDMTDALLGRGANVELGIRTAREHTSIPPSGDQIFLKFKLPR